MPNPRIRVRNHSGEEKVIDLSNWDPVRWKRVDVEPDENKIIQEFSNLDENEIDGLPDMDSADDSEGEVFTQPPKPKAKKRGRPKKRKVAVAS